MRYAYDLAVIGAGPGGYVAAIYAAKSGLSVALIEKDKTLGGTCLNRGCIPMKTLLHSATLWEAISGCREFGIQVGDASIDVAAIQRRKDAVVEFLTGNVAQLMKRNHITVIHGHAHVESPHVIQVDHRQVTAANILLATGSRPARLRIEGADLPAVMDSDEALSLSELPKSLVVIGGGVIGLELAYYYRTLGTEVTIIEFLPRLVDRCDELISAGLEQAMKAMGVCVYTSSRVEKITPSSDGACVYFTGSDGLVSVQGQRVLMAVGRSPVMDVADGLIQTNRGFAVVNDRMETSAQSIYAVGDVTGKLMLAHVASHQGMVAVDNMLGCNSVMHYDAVPSCIYTSPEAAGVGLTEREAKEKYGTIRTSLFPFSASGKALTMGQTDGFVKLIANETYGQIIGAHILGPHATELIAELALAVKMESTAEEIFETIHAHPTLSEASMEAALLLVGKQIHLP